MTISQVPLFFAKSYYRLTAYLPRALPVTANEIEGLRHILIMYFGLDWDEPTNYTFLSQLTAGHPTSLRKSYGSMANACKKLKLAKLVSEEKELANERNRLRLEELIKKEAENARVEVEVTGSHDDHADVQDWAHNIQGDVPRVPEPALRMVEIPGGNGL